MYTAVKALRFGFSHKKHSPAKLIAGGETMQKNTEYEVRTNGIPLWDDIPKDEQDSFIRLLLETIQKSSKESAEE